MRSLIITVLLFCSISFARAQGFTKAEYFIDTDPGLNNATSIAINNNSDTAMINTSVSLASVAPGFHFLVLRAQQISGAWSLFETRGFYVSTNTNNTPDLVAAEYFIDTDPGLGNGIAISIGASGSNISFPFTVPVSVSPGFHFLCTRVKDAGNRWSIFETRGFYVSSSTNNAADITSAEYFIDNDPGTGNAIPLNVGTAGALVNFTAAVPAALPPGFHFLAIRVKDGAGIWSHYEQRGFYISTSTANAANIVAAEHYFDTDPGIGNATPTSIGSAGSTVNFTASIPASLAPGFHLIAMRVKDADGIWSNVEHRMFYISTSTSDMPVITAAEYFLDNDPGVGNGQQLTISPQGNTVNQVYNITLPLGMTDGQHFLAIRVKDQAGNWGLFDFDTLNISGTVPVTGLSFFAKKSGRDARLDWFTVTENNSSHFDIERRSGIDFIRIASKQAAGNSQQRKDYNFIDPSPGKGSHYYRVKQIDHDGKFVYSETRSVTLDEKNTIQVFPTITNNIITVKGITENVKVMIFNSNKQLVRSITTNSSLFTMDMQNLATGSYWLIIEQDGKIIDHHALIKQ